MIFIERWLLRQNIFPWSWKRRFWQNNNLASTERKKTLCYWIIEHVLKERVFFNIWKRVLFSTTFWLYNFYTPSKVRRFFCLFGTLFWKRIGFLLTCKAFQRGENTRIQNIIDLYIIICFSHHGASNSRTVFKDSRRVWWRVKVAL